MKEPQKRKAPSPERQKKTVRIDQDAFLGKREKPKERPKPPQDKGGYADYPKRPSGLGFEFTRQTKRVLAGALAMAVAIGGFAYLAGGGGGDNPPDDVQATWQANLTSLQSAGGVALPPPLSADELQDQIEAGDFLPAPADELEPFIEDVRQGTVEARQLTLYDSWDEDGDVVTVTVNGASYTVPIWHAATTITVPYVEGGENVVTITGTIDGGGGVTVGVFSNGQPIPLPYIPEGQSLELPLR